MQTYSHSTLACREAQLIESARCGATDELVEYVYDRLPARARKLAAMFLETCGARLDVDDVRQAGAEMVLRRLGKALGADKPVAYLLHAAQFAMLAYCKEQRSPIRVPCSTQCHTGVRPPMVLSLDAPLVAGEDLTLLDLIPADG